MDYEAFVGAMNGAIRSVNNNIDIVEQASVNHQRAYPFGTYTITTPRMNAKVYRNPLENNVINQVFDFIISYTFYDLDFFKTSTLMHNAISNFEQRGTKQQLREKGISVIEFSNIGNRDNFISIETERRTGFDVRIRVRDISEKELEYITTVDTEEV